MIIVDLINDEAPLFIRSFDKLISDEIVSKSETLGVTEGNRWSKESQILNTVNRLLFFDELDTKEISINDEIERISRSYENFNIYACDRHLLKKDTGYQKKMLVYTYLFYENLFEKNVTHYFTTGIAFTYNLVSFEVAKKHGVKHISFYGTRIGNRTAVSYDIKNSFNEVNEMFLKFSQEKVTSEMYMPINDFANKPVQPAYMKNAINASSIKGVFIKEFFIRFRKYYLSKRHKYDLFTGNPFVLSNFKLKKIFNARKIDLFHNRIFDEVDYSEKYFIFPLHMQPEASTLILAPHHVDQKNTVINISKLLPPNIYLYVKEHKSALGQHKKSFYKELKKYPNIKLISHRQNMFELIKHSLGSINLSSTVGLESLLLKKPAIVLGSVFYEATQLIFKANSFEDLGKIISKINKDFFKVDDYFSNYDAKLAFFLFCLDSESYPFEFNVAKLDTKTRVLTDKNIKEMSNCIKKQIMK
ncbi:hypothetical protein ABN763_18585 [Spongiivirga sp. MCCC 1A20706]|uniref:capsular polysaccharide export protein, LipB/KpsS family n=1 Tax=Spongiivirga sp. MCCC 1A20706 TaxID=3160963 RepID=UPI003977D169